MNDKLKTCFKCQEAKLFTEFYKHSAMKDGVLGKCKVCSRRDSSQNRHNKIGYYRAYDRQRANNPKRILSRKEYATSSRGKAFLRQGSNLWRKENPEKSRAHNAVAKAIASKRLQKKPCSVCGNPKVQAHHDDYTKPLDVEWLCTSCHALHHKMQRASLRAFSAQEAHP